MSDFLRRLFCPVVGIVWLIMAIGSLIIVPLTWFYWVFTGSWGAAESYLKLVWDDFWDWYWND